MLCSTYFNSGAGIGLEEAVEAALHANCPRLWLPARRGQPRAGVHQLVLAVRGVLQAGTGSAFLAASIMTVAIVL